MFDHIILAKKKYFKEYYWTKFDKTNPLNKMHFFHLQLKDSNISERLLLNNRSRFQDLHGARPN